MTMRFYFAAFALIATAAAQDVRPKEVREIGKRGSGAIPQLTEFLKSPDTEVRVEAVKQLTDARGLDALIYGLYSASKFIFAGTPSGVSLSPEGGAHQSSVTASPPSCARTRSATARSW